MSLALLRRRYVGRYPRSNCPAISKAYKGGLPGVGLHTVDGTRHRCVQLVDDLLDEVAPVADGPQLDHPPGAGTGLVTCLASCHLASTPLTFTFPTVGAGGKAVITIS